MSLYARIILFIIMLAVADSASAQSKHASTIEGRVINQQGEPESGVKVKVTNHGCFKTSTTTDAYGSYKLTLEPGKYNVVVRYKQGNLDDQDIELSRNEKKKVDFFESALKKKHLEVVEEDIR